MTIRNNRLIAATFQPKTFIIEKELESCVLERVEVETETQFLPLTQDTQTLGASKIPGALIKTQIVGPHPRIFDPIDQWWDLRICILMIPGDGSDVVHLKTTFQNHSTNRPCHTPAAGLLGLTLCTCFRRSVHTIFEQLWPVLIRKVSPRLEKRFENSLDLKEVLGYSLEW